MAYTTPKKFTTGVSPELSAYLQRNRERYDISKPQDTTGLTGSFLAQARNAKQEPSMLDQFRQKEILAQAQKPIEQTPKQSWLGALGQSTGTKLASDVISTVRTVTGTAERLQASLMGGENQTVPEAMAEAYKNIVQGKEVGKNLTNLFKGLVPGIGIIPEIAKANTAFVGNVAQDATQGKFNFGQRRVESMQETALGALTSRTAPSTADRALLDTENKLRAKSEQADARLGDIGGAVTSGIGSLPSSLMASATPFGLGYAVMFLRSFRSSQEEAWAIENTTGRKLSDKDIYLYAISNGALEVATESAFNKLGAGLGKLTSKLSGGTRGANLSNAQGWLKTFVRKTVLKIGGEATTEALEKVGKNTVVKTIKDIGESAVGEGLEEVFNAIGAGVVSKYTINPNASLNFLDKESQWYYKALGLAFLSGASGGFVGGIPHGVANWLDSHGNKTLDEVVNDPEAMSSLDETLAVSAQREDVQERIEQTAVDVLQKAESEYVAEEPTVSEATSMPSEAPTMAQDAVKEQAQESTTPTAEAVAEPARAVAIKERHKEFYSVVMQEGNKPTPVRQENAKSVKLDAMPDGDFFTYSRDKAKGKLWYVVESTSGVSLVNDARTRKEAIELSNKIITERGVDFIKEAITRSINRFGLMPSYQQTAQPVEAKEQLTEVKESELVKESKKADESGRIGIVAKGFEPQAETQEPAWKKTISQKTRESIDKASKPYADRNVLSELKEKVSKFREYVTLGSVPIDVKYGDVRRLFREARSADQYAKGTAENIIAKAYNKAGKGKHELLRYAILYLDIKEDLSKGLYNKDSALAFNIESPQEALRTAEAIEKELAKDENSLVRDAIETRKRLMDEVRNELVSEGNRAGIDLRHVKAKNNYMYHAILEYQEEFNQALRAKGAKRGTNKVEYLARTGSPLDYISDPLIADFLILQKLMKDTTRLRLYNEIKKFDISSTLPYTEDTDWVIKLGFSELNPSRMGIVQFDTFDKARVREAKRAELELRGIDPKSPTGKKLMARATTHLNKNTIVVPTQIVDAVVNEFSPRERAVGKLFKNLMNVWKYTKIRLPNAVFKYNARNFFGDLDAMVAARPSALKYVPKAIKELHAYFYKGGVMTSNLQSYIKRSGMTTGQTPQELKSFKSSALIKAYEESNAPKDVATRTIRKIWKALTLETFTNFREQVLRYASYLSYARELTTNKSGLPKDYAASIPTEIQSIQNPLDRAFKLSNDLIGAYDDVSIFGQWAADHLMPFFRFTEVNMKRYYRMTKNIFHSDPSAMNSVAKDIVSKSARFARVGGVAIIRAAKLMVGISAFYGALAIANSLFAGDEEDELPEEVRNKPHLTIPRWVTGSERIYYIDRLGSLAELLDMFGIDYGLKSDLNDIATGRMSQTDKLKEIALSPLYQLYNSAWPVAKIATELITGKTYYPDPSKPSSIRDTWEYLFGQVGLKDEYKAIAGKPIADGSYWTSKRNLLWNSVLPGDAALYDTMDMVNDYYAYIGESSTYNQFMDKDTDKYKRSQAAYYYKMALKLDDYKAAEKYLAEYVAYGGTKKTLKQTMQYIDPTAGMNASKRADFLEWLTPEQKERYDKGMEWYREILEASAEMEFPSE